MSTYSNGGSRVDARLGRMDFAVLNVLVAHFRKTFENDCKRCPRALADISIPRTMALSPEAIAWHADYKDEERISASCKKLLELGFVEVAAEADARPVIKAEKPRGGVPPKYYQPKMVLDIPPASAASVLADFWTVLTEKTSGRRKDVDLSSFLKSPLASLLVLAAVPALEEMGIQDKAFQASGAIVLLNHLVLSKQGRPGGSTDEALLVARCPGCGLEVDFVPFSRVGPFEVKAP